MGAHPYWYVVKHQADTQRALDELRQRELQAGRYNPAVSFPVFPIDPRSPAPGPRHDFIQEAIEDAAEDGTRSVLDIFFVRQETDFGTASPLSDEVLEDLYGTTQPTRQMIEENMDFLEDVERGHCSYVLVHKDFKPDELFFAGYSFD